MARLLCQHGRCAVYLPGRNGAGFRRSAFHATPAPIKINASVALKLPGAMQLMQLVMIIGTSFMLTQLRTEMDSNLTMSIHHGAVKSKGRDFRDQRRPRSVTHLWNADRQ
jgi:hypothetical protein